MAEILINDGRFTGTRRTLVSASEGGQAVEPKETIKKLQDILSEQVPADREQQVTAALEINFLEGEQGKNIVKGILNGSLK